MKAAPPHLHSLHANIELPLDAKISSNLHSVTQISGIHLDDWSNLPRSLTKVNLPLPITNNSLVRLMESLPPKLKFLYLSKSMIPSIRIEQQWFSALPRELEILSCIRIPIHLDAEIIDDWPKTLQRANLASLCSLELEPGFTKLGKSVWPPALTQLNLSAMSNQILPFIKYLPSTLNHIGLGLHEPEETVSINTSELPPLLTSLSLVNRDAEDDYPTLNFVGPLPRLKNWCTIGFRISPSILPNSLTQLNVDPQAPRYLLYPFEYAFTPLEHLTMLDTTTWRWDWFSLLPRSLTELCIKYCQNFDEELILQGQDVFIALPPGLRVLEIRDSIEPFQFSGLSFSTLYRLEGLSLGSTLTFHSSIFKTLPKTLRGLSMTVVSLAENVSLIPNIPTIALNLNAEDEELFDAHAPLVARTSFGQPCDLPALLPRFEEASRIAKCYPDPRIIISSYVQP